MSHTYSPGDRSSDPGSHYGTCCSEDIECPECQDTGVLGDLADSQDYCECEFGRYLQRVEGEED